MKDKINNLDISEKLKDQLSNLFLNSETSSIESDDENYQIDNLENYSTTSSDNEKEIEKIDYSNTKNNINNCKCINMISDNLFLKLVDSISDKEKQKELLSNYKNDMTGSPVEIKNKHIEPYSMNELMERIQGTNINKNNKITTKDLQIEISNLKKEIAEIKLEVNRLKIRDKGKEIISIPESSQIETDSFIQYISKKLYQKWYTNIKIEINNEYHIETTALIDSGADSNCIREGLVPTKYYEKTTQKLYSAEGNRMKINYKLTNVKVCKDKICIKTPFVLIQGMNENIIIGTPFLTQIYPFKVNKKGLSVKLLGNKLHFDFILPPIEKEVKSLQEETITKINMIKNKTKHINFLKNEIKTVRIEEHLNDNLIQNQIKEIEDKIKKELCSNLPNAFWNRKKHIVDLPYEENFNDRMIPTKAKPIQMNIEMTEICKKEINDLLEKKLIRPSKSPWSCAAFYVYNNAEIERKAPRLVINYKPLNKVLKWIRYPLPNKTELLKRLYEARIFSKFDMKSGYWQIQIKEEDKYKTAFTVPFGQYEWNVMPFGLKNAPSEYQKIMNDIFNPYSKYIIVYIDDVLVFSNSLSQHFTHLEKFMNIIKINGLVISAPKLKIFQTNIRFLGHNIYNNTITPIDRSLEFVTKFPDEIKDKTQLQRFLGCLNYVADFYPNIRIICKPLFDRLKKNPEPWSQKHTDTVKLLKETVPKIECLTLPNPLAQLIVETDASDNGYGGILKQNYENNISIIRYTSGVWNNTQKNYSTVKKEILSIVLCITKFQSDLINKKFILKTDCKAAKDVLNKDVKNLVSKQIFARWQAILSCFDFEIGFIKGENNHFADFLTREFLQKPPT